MKRSKIQGLHAGCLGQTIATALFAEYNHFCILMLNVSIRSYYKEEDIDLVTVES